MLGRTISQSCAKRPPTGEGSVHELITLYTKNANVPLLILNYIVWVMAKEQHNQVAKHISQNDRHMAGVESMQLQSRSLIEFPLCDSADE